MPRIPFDDGESNKVHNLDDVNDRLYRRDLADRKVRRIDSLHPKPVSVQKDWATEDLSKEKIGSFAAHPSFFRKFFYFALGFAVLAIAFALFMLFTGGNTISNNAIDINVLGNSFTAGGDELPLQAEIVNKNASDLQLADLIISYNKGGDSASGSSNVSDLNSLGTIGAGKTVSKSFFVTLYGTEGSVQNVTFTLQYRLPGSNAIFVKTTVFPVTINSSPIALSVDAPQNLTPNQEVTFTVKTKSNSTNTLSGMLLHVDYPTGFNFEKATPSPDSLNDTWDLGDLAPGAERDISITGTVYGQDGEDRAFHIYTGAASASDATKIGVTYNSLLQTVSLVKPFLGATLSLNGSTADTVNVPSTGNVNVAVNYTNNLPSVITNAQVSVKLSGNALDPSTIHVQDGFYDSSTNTVTWDSTSSTGLTSIQPSAQGQLSFSFGFLPLVSSGSVISSPQVKLSVSAKGKEADQGSTVQSVDDFTSATAMVSSDLAFSANPTYYSGPFSNTGSIPPKANEPTTYTVTWTVTNSANPLSSGVATAQLPTYVEWVGTASPSSELISYDNTSRTITWNFGQVPAGAGVTGPARVVAFQVRLKPSTSQVGTSPDLVLPVSVSAKDTFTGDTLTTTKLAVSTLLENDPGFPPGGQTVTN